MGNKIVCSRKLGAKVVIKLFTSIQGKEMQQNNMNNYSRNFLQRSIILFYRNMDESHNYLKSYEKQYDKDFSYCCLYKRGQSNFVREFLLFCFPLGYGKMLLLCFIF